METEPPDIAPPFVRADVHLLYSCLWVPHQSHVQWHSNSCGFLNKVEHCNEGNSQPSAKVLLKEEHRSLEEEKILSRKIRFFPTAVQKKILRQAEQAYRWTYNVTSRLIEDQIQPFVTPEMYDDYAKERLLKQQKPSLTEAQRDKWMSKLELKQASLRNQESLYNNILQKQAILPRKNFIKQIESKKKAIKKLEDELQFIQDKLQGKSSKTKESAGVFKGWLDAYAVRNFIVTVKNNPLFGEAPLPVNAIDFVSEKRQWLMDHPDLKALIMECHKDIRAQGVKDAIANFKSQSTNQRLGHQNKGNSPYKRFRKLCSQGFCVPIPKTSLYIEKIKGHRHLMLFKRSFQGSFGSLNFGRNQKKVMQWFSGMFPHPDCFKDFKIIFNTKTDRYHLVLPYAHIQSSRNSAQEDSSSVIASIDIGSKPRHAVYYTNGEAAMFGTKDKNGKHDITRLCQVKAKERYWYRKLNNKNTKSKRRRNIKKKLRKLAERIQNILHDADYKTIKSVLDKADVVLIPKFDAETQKRGGGFNKQVRVDSKLYSHSRFVERMKMKARIRGKTVIQVIEPYTSKTCTRCLSLKNDLGSSKVYRCSHCDFVGDRDLCGARNILILNRDLFDWTITQGSSSHETEA